MSERERTRTRDLTYSEWHRTDNLKKFLNWERAWRLKQIDIDWCEYCCWCNKPIALIETQRSLRGTKPATVTTALAQMAGIPAFSVAYATTDQQPDISQFLVRELWPQPNGELLFSPAEYASWLESLRLPHWAEFGKLGSCKESNAA